MLSQREVISETSEGKKKSTNINTNTSVSTAPVLVDDDLMDFLLDDKNFQQLKVFSLLFTCVELDITILIYNYF